MENEKKIIIDDLVSEILKDYQDDKVINQQAIFSQPDKVFCSFSILLQP